MSERSAAKVMASALFLAFAAAGIVLHWSPAWPVVAFIVAVVVLA